MADAYVTASRSEGLPFSVMEAMYKGLPVVASAVKGHLDLIEDGKNGFLYTYGDASACAACVKRIMDNPAFRKAIQSFSKESMAKYDIGTVLPGIVSQYLQPFENAKRL